MAVKYDKGKIPVLFRKYCLYHTEKIIIDGFECIASDSCILVIRIKYNV